MSMLARWLPSGMKKFEARIYCPKCTRSKTIEGWDTIFWWNANSKIVDGRPMTHFTNCDKCASVITYRVTRDGVETP